MPWTLSELRRAWNRAKREVAPWWAQNSKEAYSSGLDGLARALKNWQDSNQRRRAGAIRVEADRHHVTLPRLGRVRTHESTRNSPGAWSRETARIMTATILRTQGRWFVSFTCEVTRTVGLPRRPRAAIGVDVGIRHLACSLMAD